MSVDALRGFDMFWIIGADSLVYALNRMSKSGPTEFLANQLEHAEWAGFHFYDLIFPLFVFIVGVSLVFSLSKTLQAEGTAAALKRVCRRGLLLFVIGILYSGGFTNPWPDMRLMGVLNRIALAYCFAGVLFCFFKPRTLVLICAALLGGYWSLMTFMPIRQIQLTKPALVELAEKRGQPDAANCFANQATLQSPRTARRGGQLKRCSTPPPSAFPASSIPAIIFPITWIFASCRGRSTQLLRPGRYPQYYPGGCHLPSRCFCWITPPQPKRP